MCRFIESIRLENGVISNHKYHQDRVNMVFKAVFPACNPISLNEYLRNQELPDVGLFKCRLIYDTDVRFFEMLPYQMRQIHSFKLVEADVESTHFKPEDRNLINLAYAQRGECDDVLIVRDGLITDSSYCNVAFYDGKIWKTPRIPLYYGTRRASLLDSGLIEEADIPADSIHLYQKIMFFNAMIPFGELEIELNITT
jgi:4-amino-4-deoxychorismate lyase